jgi:hypothetical protein
MLEITLAMLNGLRIPAIIFGVLTFIAILTCIGAISDSDVHADTKATLRKALPFAVVFMLLCTLVFAVPTPRTLLTYRITLIGYNLASQENLEKGAEHLINLTKKLECRYLDICEEEK